MSELIELVNSYRLSVSSRDQEAALAEIVEGIEPEIYLFLATRVPGQEVSSLTNETLVSVFKGLKGFRGSSNAEFWGWVYQIARKRVAQYFEKAEKSEGTIVMDPTIIAELLEKSGSIHPFENEEQRTKVISAIEELRSTDPEGAAILQEHYFAGLPYSVIGEIYGKSPEAVRMKASRAMDKLETILKKGSQ
jgi:RNA polymerase sigma factor (sigma-70 family)